MKSVQLEHDPCLQIQADLSAMLDGELHAASVRRVMVHSDVCESCKGFLNGIRAQAAAIQDLNETGLLDGSNEVASERARLLRKKLVEKRDHLAVILYELGRGFVLMGVSPNFSRVVSREPVPIPDMCLRGQSLIDEVERMSDQKEDPVGGEWVRAKELFGNGRLNNPAENLEKGTRLLIECLLLKPDFHEARIYLGHAFHVGDQCDEAVSQFKVVIDEAQDQKLRAFALVNLGNVYLDNGEWEGSIPLFRELVDSGIIAKQPRFCMTFFNLALACGLLERFEECHHWFERLHVELPHKRSMIAKELQSRRQLFRVLKRHPQVAADLAQSFPDWFPIREEAC